MADEIGFVILMISLFFTSLVGGLGIFGAEAFTHYESAVATEAAQIVVANGGQTSQAIAWVQSQRNLSNATVTITESPNGGPIPFGAPVTVKVAAPLPVIYAYPTQAIGVAGGSGTN